MIVFLSVLEYQIEFKKEDRNQAIDQILMGNIFTTLLICSVVLGFFNVLHAIVLFRYERLRKSLIAREHRLTLDYIAKRTVETLLMSLVPLQSLYNKDEKLTYYNLSIN